MAHDLDVDWSESISAIETEDSVIFFTDANAPHLKKKRSCGGNTANFDGFTRPNETISERLSRRQLGSFQSFFPSGKFLYSLTAHNPMNLPQNDAENEAQNRLLLKDLQQVLPGCKIWENYSYFPVFPHHYERGFTIVVPEDSPRPHGRIIRHLSIKYRQAAYFRCRLASNGSVSQKLIFPDDSENEAELELVVIGKFSFYPERLPLHELSNGSSMDTENHCQGFRNTEVEEFLNFRCQFSLPMFGHEFQFSRRTQCQVDRDSSPPILDQREQESDYLTRPPPVCVQHLGHLFNGSSYSTHSYYVGNNETRQMNTWNGRRRASEADIPCPIKLIPAAARRRGSETERPAAGRRGSVSEWPAAGRRGSETERPAAGRRGSVTEWPGEARSPSSDMIVLLSLETAQKEVKSCREATVGRGNVTMGTFNWINLDQHTETTPTGSSATMTIVIKS